MGGGGQHVVVNEQEQQRHRRRRAGTQVVAGGLDHPPSVSSPLHGVWQLRTLQPRTFCRICTLVHPKLSPDHAIYAGAAPVAPLILLNYVMSATDDSRLLFYSLKYNEQKSQIGLAGSQEKAALRKQQLDRDAVLPTHVVQLSGSVVALAVGCLVAGHESEHVVALTCEGEMHVVDVNNDEDNVPKLVFSCETGSLSPSNVCIQNDGTVFVSYRSGCLAAWQLTVPVIEQENKRIPSWNQSTIKLVWRGAFDTCILSISTIDRGGRTPYLAVCIGQPPPHEGLGKPTSSSTLEVLDISTIADDWKNRNESIDSLALRDYLIWPGEGRELVDSSTDDMLPRRQSGRASMGSDRLVAGEGFFATVLSDGTVAILHSNVVLANEKPSLLWGVENDINQALMQFPAIGLGQVNLTNGPHLACSLRGGTTYLLPIASKSETQSAVPVFLFPEKDDEEDGEALRYLHGFTAGNINIKEGNTPLPVLIYSGDGGLIEVYACDLLGHTVNTAQEQLCIEEMHRNGSLDLLLKVLQFITEEDHLLDVEEWKNAYLAATGLGERMNATSVVNDNDTYRAIRFLALALARTS